MLLTRISEEAGRPAFRRLARLAATCAAALLPWAAVTAAILLVADACYNVCTASADGAVFALLEVGIELAMAGGCLALAAALRRDSPVGPSDGHSLFSRCWPSDCLRPEHHRRVGPPLVPPVTAV